MKKEYKHVIIVIMIFFGVLAIVSTVSASHVKPINDFDKGHKTFNIDNIKKFHISWGDYRRHKGSNDSIMSHNSSKIGNNGIETVVPSMVPPINKFDNNEAYVIIGYPGSSYTKCGYNESSNVILEFKLSPASDPHFGGVSQLWVYINLYFKNNNTPIPNQKVYMIVGNKTFNYTTDLDGSIVDIFVPDVYGYTEFQFLFNGSVIQDNESIIYLEPVSAYGYYILSDPWIIRNITLVPWVPPMIIVEILPDPPKIVDYPKNITINESKYSYTNNTKQKDTIENNHQIAHGKMKETGVPLIQLILSLITVLGILRFKNNI